MSIQLILGVALSLTVPARSGTNPLLIAYVFNDSNNDENSPEGTEKYLIKIEFSKKGTNWFRL